MMKAIFFGQLLLIFKVIKCQDTFCSDRFKKLVEEFKAHELRCPNKNDNGLCCAAEKSSFEERFKNFDIICSGEWSIYLFIIYSVLLMFLPVIKSIFSHVSFTVMKGIKRHYLFHYNNHNVFPPPRTHSISRVSRAKSHTIYTATSLSIIKSVLILTVQYSRRLFGVFVARLYRGTTGPIVA